MINQVVLVGRLTKDPEIKYTQNNVANVRFTVAVNRQFTDKHTGERQADFITCVSWRDQAENLARFQKKGSLLGITGRIETGSYQAQDGSTRFTTDIVCDSIQYLEPRGGNNGNHAHQNSQPNQSANSGGFNNEPSFNSTIDISDDDLPF